MVSTTKLSTVMISEVEPSNLKKTHHVLFQVFVVGVIEQPKALAFFMVRACSWVRHLSYVPENAERRSSCLLLARFCS